MCDCTKRATIDPELWGAVVEKERRSFYKQMEDACAFSYQRGPFFNDCLDAKRPLIRRLGALRFHTVGTMTADSPTLHSARLAIINRHCPSSNSSYWYATHTATKYVPASSLAGMTPGDVLYYLGLRLADPNKLQKPLRVGARWGASLLSVVHPEDRGALESMLGELGAIWSAPPITVGVTLSAAPSSFARLGRYGVDSGSCYRMGHQYEGAKYELAAHPDALVAIIFASAPETSGPDSAPRKGATILARAWLLFNDNGGEPIAYVNNLYSHDLQIPQIHPLILSALQEALAPGLKRVAGYPERPHSLGDSVYINCSAQAYESAPDTYCGSLFADNDYAAEPYENCGCCGTRMDEDSSTYCEDCNETVCTDCSSYVESVERCVCDSCRENYSECEMCDEVYPDNDITRCEAGGCYALACPDCVQIGAEGSYCSAECLCDAEPDPEEDEEGDDPSFNVGQVRT